MKTVPHPGYRARNLDVATAVGLNAGLCALQFRMAQRKDCPTWVITLLSDLIQRSNRIITPLVLYRDEIPTTMEVK